MRHFNALIGLVLLILLTLGGAPARTSAMDRGAPCYIQLPALYLVYGNARHHIADWDTFLDLGYTQADIVPCGNNAAYPEGSPITRLLKGSDVPVYWMENGARRHIPDMDTFSALGFQVRDITVVPDSVLAWWPLADPLPSRSRTPQASQQVIIGNYTIRIWPHTEGFFDYATISAPGQADVRIADVESIGALPVPSVTGDGHPGVLFMIRGVGSGHCCWGMTLYELGATPIPVLDMISIPYWDLDTGRGEFKDLDGDGVYEVITNDALPRGCSQQTVQVVLRYNAGQHRYIPASPQYANSYQAMLANLTTAAETSTDKLCTTTSLSAQLLYLGQETQARAAFDRFYTDQNAKTVWSRLVETVHQGRYYVPAA